MKETEASITNKLAGGTFPAAFFLACLTALELDGKSSFADDGAFNPSTKPIMMPRATPPNDLGNAERSLMQRRHMDLLNLWLPLIGGGILGATAIGAWFGDHKTAAVWFGFSGAVCLLLLGALHIQELVSSPEQPGLSPATILDQRPWVSVDVQLIPPLVYDDKGWDAGFRWHVAIDYTLGNGGKTPAVNAEFFANLIPFIGGGWTAEKIKNGKPEGPPEPATDVPAELKKLCASVKYMRSALGPMQNNLLFRDKKIGGRFNLNANPQLFGEAASNPLYSGNLVLLVCTIYGSTLDKAVYETAASYAVFRNNADIDLRADRTPVVIPDILVASQPSGGAYAN